MRSWEVIRLCTVYPTGTRVLLDLGWRKREGFINGYTRYTGGLLIVEVNGRKIEVHPDQVIEVLEVAV